MSSLFDQQKLIEWSMSEPECEKTEKNGWRRAQLAKSKRIFMITH